MRTKGTHRAPIALLAVVALALSLAACGPDPEQVKQDFLDGLVELSAENRETLENMDYETFAVPISPGEAYVFEWDVDDESVTLVAMNPKASERFDDAYDTEYSIPVELKQTEEGQLVMLVDGGFGTEIYPFSEFGEDSFAFERLELADDVYAYESLQRIRFDGGLEVRVPNTPVLNARSEQVREWASNFDRVADSIYYAERYVLEDLAEAVADLSAMAAELAEMGGDPSLLDAQDQMQADIDAFLEEMEAEYAEYAEFTTSEQNARFASLKSDLQSAYEHVLAAAAGDAASADAEPTSGGNDYDRVLDEYEDVVEAMEAAAEKLEADATDATALTDLTNANLESVQLAQELQTAQGEMTSDQVSRLSDLANRAAQAALKMSGNR